MNSLRLLREGVLDAESMALLWLLEEGGVPVAVIGEASLSDRTELANAVVSLPPQRAWVVIDADAQPPTTERLAALLQGGVGLAMTMASPDLKTLMQDPGPLSGLPEDGIRRLGVVLVLGDVEARSRCTAVHYLRPSERDGQGHIQRRPPAVLATWDDLAGRHEHYAWGITPELADRVDRSQADFEERQHDRAAFLTAAVDVADDDVLGTRLRAYLEAEPQRVPAPMREPAQGSASGHGLTDPHSH